MSKPTKPKLNDASAKMADILNHGALNLALCIGYRTGIFDAMDALEGPATIEIIAAKAGVDQRYLKEWLGIMVCGGIVMLSKNNAGDDLFHLSRAWGDLLARRVGNANMGVYTQEIPLLTQCAMEPVASGFRTGDGVSYNHYPRFQAFMTQLANAKHQQTLVDRFLPLVEDGKMLKRLQDGAVVCDLGCGEGVAALLMAKAFPASHFTGVDMSAEAIAVACREAACQNLKNLIFIQRDAVGMEADPGFANTFDYITAFDSIHDQTRPLEALKSIWAALKPGGCFSMVDIAASTEMAGNKDHPMGPFLYTVSLMHCMPVGLVDGGAGLGMMWGKEKAAAMLEKAGFRQIQVNEIPEDPFNLHFFCKK